MGDMVTYFTYAKTQNLRDPQYHINSENSFLSNNMDFKSIKKILRQEFAFYDENYFKDRDSAGLKWNFSCHGMKEELIPLSSGNDMTYANFLEEICYAANFRTKKANIPKQVNWNFTAFFDACFSGSALYGGRKWVEKNGGRVLFKKIRNHLGDLIDRATLPGNNFVPDSR